VPLAATFELLEADADGKVCPEVTGALFELVDEFMRVASPVTPEGLVLD
jgi:hypothetical protein